MNRVQSLISARREAALAVDCGGRYDSAMSITATVENDTIKLPSGVHLPDGTQVHLEPVAAGVPMKNWPAGYFEHTAGALVGERFDRPEQEAVERREDW